MGRSPHRLPQASESSPGTPGSGGWWRLKKRYAEYRGAQLVEEVLEGRPGRRSPESRPRRTPTPSRTANAKLSPHSG